MAGGDKIKLFKFIKKTYQDIGISPPQSNQNYSPINSENWFFIFCFAQFFISSAAFLFIKANSAIEYGMAFFTCTTIVSYFILYLILFWQMKNLLNYIERCEELVEKRTLSTILYRDTNEKIERLTEYLAYALSVTTVIIVLLPLLNSVVNYYLLDAGKESFFLVFPAWYPFDWQAPFGYLVAWSGQCVGTVVVIATAISFFNTIFGSSWLFIVIAKDITNDAAAFNNTVGTPKDSDRVELTERFCNIIQHYSGAKQFVNDFNKMFKYLLFALFLWDIIAISTILMSLQFQLWDDDSNLFEIMILSMIILWIFVFILVVCEPGQRVTDQFDEFGVEFGRSEWNKLPIEMQRMYLVFLSDTQQPKYIQSYSGILCTRETFKQITHKGFSYFMTLRRFRA